MKTLRQANRCIYWAWKSMKQRCQNPKCQAYRNYGARGITVCDEWQQFEPFYEWAVSSGYERGFDIDRINNNGEYSPANCRWVSRRANINNRRKTIMLTVDGETMPRTVWEDVLELPHGTVKSWVITRGTEYAEERLREIIEVGYTPKDYSRNHVKVRVRCEENGKVYNSIREAARDLGVSNGNIAAASRNGGSIHGYHFIRL